MNTIPAIFLHDSCTIAARCEHDPNTIATLLQYLDDSPVTTQLKYKTSIEGCKQQMAAKGVAVLYNVLQLDTSNSDLHNICEHMEIEHVFEMFENSTSYFSCCFQILG